MKTKTKILLFLTVLFISITPVFAAQELELNPVSELVGWLSPIIVFLAGLVVKASKIIPGWIMVTIAVPLLSFAYTLLTSDASLSEGSFWLQFAYGLGAVFVNETKKKIQEQITAAP